MACEMLLRETIVKRAQKEYECIASLWIADIQRYWLNDMLTFSEKRAYIIAKRNGFRILPGETYVKQVQITDDGDLFTYRAIPAMNDICYKYHFFEE